MENRQRVCAALNLLAEERAAVVSEFGEWSDEALSYDFAVENLQGVYNAARARAGRGRTHAQTLR